MRRVLWIAVAAILVAATIVGGRRWVHHAQLELVPVIIAPGTDAQAVLAPSSGAIVARMTEDVRDALERPARPRLAVLTFDDGPYPVESSALVAQLAAQRVPADFFLIGDDVRTQPAIGMRIRDAGVEIGNHSLTHPEMAALTYDRQAAEVTGGADVLRTVLGTTARYFRPPHGNYDASTLRAAWASGESVALWDIDPGDWRSLTADEIVTLVVGQARAPAVIILHNGKDATIDALPRIVAAYRAAGFEFVTLSELERRVPLDVINDPEKIAL
jgi:peptidoglycan/xylan/chitin deacetylase (PgdA/CDA1 family)